MLLAFYSHRLPSQFDTQQIRTRAVERGPLWDQRPDLLFKTFLLREQGLAGAANSSYASLYLWRNETAFCRFLRSDDFQAVVAAFGRPRIDTWYTLDVQRGHAINANYAYKTDLDIEVDVGLAEVCVIEAVRNQQQAEHSSVYATAVGIDTRDWRLTRVNLSEQALDLPEPARRFDILHLARPHIGDIPAR